MRLKINNATLQSTLPWILLIGGLIGLVASLILSVEVYDRLKDPSYKPVCNISPILNCTSVADSPQSQAFGFPNYYLGIASYAAVATIGMVLLAGAKLKRWFWQAVEAGLVFATVFTIWLQFQSLYRIGSLCIFCMVIWAVTIPIFLYTTLYNLRANHIKTPTRLAGLNRFAQRYHLEILVTWFLIIIGLILKRFWYYWSTL